MSEGGVTPACSPATGKGAALASSGVARPVLLHGIASGYLLMFLVSAGSILLWYTPVDARSGSDVALFARTVEGMFAWPCGDPFRGGMSIYGFPYFSAAFLLAAPWKLLGCSSPLVVELALRCASVVFAIGSLYVAFDLVSRLYPGAGRAYTVLLAWVPVLLLRADAWEVHPDGTALFFSLLALRLAMARGVAPWDGARCVAIGLCLGLATLAKTYFGTLWVPFLVWIVSDSAAGSGSPGSRVLPGRRFPARVGRLFAGALGAVVLTASPAVVHLDELGNEFVWELSGHSPVSLTLLENLKRLAIEDSAIHNIPALALLLVVAGGIAGRMERRGHTGLLAEDPVVRRFETTFAWFPFLHLFAMAAATTGRGFVPFYYMNPACIFLLVVALGGGHRLVGAARARRAAAR